MQVVNEPGKAQALRQASGPHAGLEEGLRAPGRRARRSTTKAPKCLRQAREADHGTHQTQADFAGHALRRQGRPLAPAQGRAARAADRVAEARPARATTSAASPRATRAAVTSRSTASSTSSATRTASPGTVERLEYDPNRTAHIALVKYADGERRYILAPKGMSAGRRRCVSGADSPDQAGQCACRCATSRSARWCTTSS